MSGDDSSSMWARRPRPVVWLRTHPMLADGILAAVLTSVSVAFHLLDLDTDTENFTDPAWWTVPLVIASVLPIAWRRSNPIAVALFVVSVQTISAIANVDGTGFIGVLVALYSVGAHTSGRTRSRAVTVIALILAALFVSGLIADEVPIGDFLSSTVVLVTGFVLGDNLRRRRDAANALQERLERAERERELIAQQRVTAERTRIARELHDVVAHSVSAIVIQAAAARRSLHTAPHDAAVALANIEVTGRQTMNELRNVLGVLRRTEPDRDAAPDDSLAPQPVLAAIPELLAASTDLPIEARLADDLTGVASGTDLTGFRIVQEALTNVRRHAGPVTKVLVVVERHEHTIEIVVSDDGRGAAADENGPGYGLVGMSERVAATRGTLDVAPRAGGGWRVAAVLPIETADVTTNTSSPEPSDSALCDAPPVEPTGLADVAVPVESEPAIR